MSTVVRRGKTRSHPEGYSLNIFLDPEDLYTGASDSTLLATVYGGEEGELLHRAKIVARALATTYGAEVRL